MKHEKEEHNLPFYENQLDEKYITTEILPANNSETKTLTCVVEYDIDDTLEIKEEIIQEKETVNMPKCDKRYKSKLRTTEKRDYILVDKKLLNQKKQKTRKAKQNLENKYVCEKCAKSYKWRDSLVRHKKLECNVIPQFICKFCSKQFTQKGSMNIHINDMHLCKYLKSSKKKHICDKCFRSYTAISALYRHQRLEHAAVKPQFNCDCCGFKTKEKCSLSKHIISRHLK
ncbi:zinc finger protein 585B-like [Belonocnema kinseyi]|uniref:zinc finger protein 585B-like n=1 Tax=Belonocnema kinseyi TaxID=2817044 RepID=UPI00143D64A2|nr:zinc finger protein 585B-like [Belonocnema kinseyi]